jgi:Carbohydrate esterase, sialic acid-specific acetylesterase
MHPALHKRFGGSKTANYHDDMGFLSPRVINTVRRWSMVAVVSVCLGAFPSAAADFPEDAASFDVFLLIGQSNMKGRGQLGEESATDSRVWMFPLDGDRWMPARDPLHAAGGKDLIDGSNIAGVGPGMSFARTVLGENPRAVIGLVPAAVGGSWIALWRPGHRKSLYDEAVRRVRLALDAPVEPKPRLRGVLWLQGESDSTAARHVVYQKNLLRLVDDLRTEFGDPQLPFIACTIGSFIEPHPRFDHTKQINEILLGLPGLRDATATVDARDLTGHIGDRLHYDTAAQNEIGKRFAAKLEELRANKSPGNQPTDAP